MAAAGLALVGAAPALADAIAGATYIGRTPSGARVQFTVSSDGTIVDSYSVTGLYGDTCLFQGEGDQAIWQGAPIVSGAFSYQLGDAIFFRGTFDGAQSASGTVRFYNHASSRTPACDTGTVSWKAATTASPPAPPTGGGPDAPPPGTPNQGHVPPGSGNGSTQSRRTLATRVSLRRLSRTRIGGRLSSPDRSCRAGRTVFLLRGTRRIATTKTRRDGTFSFARSARVRGKSVRAMAPLRSGSTSICGAGSSTRMTA
jgi:hypothetical protein